MILKKCVLCDRISNDFQPKRPCTHAEYMGAFVLMRNLVKTGDIVFLAGSCPLDELEKYLEIEDLYTIEHYFKCRCGKIYYTGCCIRGRSILDVVNSLPVNIKITISGRYGSYFEETAKTGSFIKKLFKKDQ